MSPHSTIVEQRVAAVHRRKNLHRLWTTLIWAATVGAALMIVVGLFYVLQGYAVPGEWIGAIFGLVSLAAIGVWAARRMSVERAARFMDRFFELQDTVTSYLHFASQGRSDGYYALQSQQTADRVAKLDAGAIRYQPPRRLLCLAIVLLAMAIPIGLCPPSAAVLERLATEQMVASETAAIKEQLTDETEKLIKETPDKQEERLLEPSKLRRWVDELKATTDRTEALRQYARLERKINDIRQSLQRKEDEQLLERAAAELAKSDETKPMADALARKDYDKAAEKLNDLKPDKSKAPDQQRRDMARLKAIAQRMALAAQVAKAPAHGGKSATGKQSVNRTSANKQDARASANSSASKSGGKGGSPGEGSLAQMIDELAESADEFDDSENGTEKTEGVCEKVDELSDKLKKLGMCRRVECRLGKLCRCCGECQGNVSCASPNAGGLKAGWGSNSARRTDRDELVDNGQTTQIKGLKGAGPSLTAVEAAESGSGVSNRQATARDRAFKHQFESFVQREDVPEAVRDGVKQYFQIIHEADAEASSKGDSKE